MVRWVNYEFDEDDYELFKKVVDDLKKGKQDNYDFQRRRKNIYRVDKELYKRSLIDNCFLDNGDYIPLKREIVINNYYPGEDDSYPLICSRIIFDKHGKADVSSPNANVPENLQQLLESGKIFEPDFDSISLIKKGIKIIHPDDEYLSLTSLLVPIRKRRISKKRKDEEMEKVAYDYFYSEGEQKETSSQKKEIKSPKGREAKPYKEKVMDAARKLRKKKPQMPKAKMVYRHEIIAAIKKDTLTFQETPSDKEYKKYLGVTRRTILSYIDEALKK